MARPRAQSTNELPKEPHSISLKVLRLSRPSLSYQFPLPLGQGQAIPVKASLSYPSQDSCDKFILSPNLTLPPAFGSAYVGETFSCSLCANNELPPGDDSKVISLVKIKAEMQTPSQTIALELMVNKVDSPDDGQHGLEKSESLLKVVRFDLKEEGNHVLAVSVTYTETSSAPHEADTGVHEKAGGGRSRTFRKLYQFIALPCLSVRTKSSELPSQEVEDRSLGPYGKSNLLRFALEAQLENVGETAIYLERTTLIAKAPFESTSLHHQALWPDIPDQEPPLLDPHDVLQVAFLVEQKEGEKEGVESLQNDLRREGRTALGQLSIEWRGPMGDKGFLTTGYLLTRRR